LPQPASNKRASSGPDRHLAETRSATVQHASR
jgi:hypothetical protein